QLAGPGTQGTAREGGTGPADQCSATSVSFGNAREGGCQHQQLVIAGANSVKGRDRGAFKKGRRGGVSPHSFCWLVAGEPHHVHSAASFTYAGRHSHRWRATAVSYHTMVDH